MVTMSNVWDRATDVVHGRAGILASIAVATLYLPGLLRDAVPLLARPGSVGFALSAGLLSIGVLLIAIWGQLALLAVAIDPAVTRPDANRQATRRYPAALAVTIVALLVLMALLIPFGVAIGLSGADLSGMATTGTMPDLGAGTVAFIGLYALLLVVVGIAVAARLALTTAVVLAERRGLGAFARSWQLTRGLTWRLIGVLLLYGVMIGISVLAAQLVAGAVFGLVLGRDGLSIFLAAVVTGAVTTIFTVLASAFTAQLYVATTDRGVATVFE